MHLKGGGELLEVAGELEGALDADLLVIRVIRAIRVVKTNWLLRLLGLLGLVGLVRSVGLS